MHQIHLINLLEFYNLLNECKKISHGRIRFRNKVQPKAHVTLAFKPSKRLDGPITDHLG